MKDRDSLEITLKNAELDILGGCLINVIKAGLALYLTYSCISNLEFNKPTTERPYARSANLFENSVKH